MSARALFLRDDLAAGTWTNSEMATRTWAVSRAISWVGSSMAVLVGKGRRHLKRDRS